MPRTTTRSTIELDRKKLLTALQRVGWVVPNHTSKPILQGIHLEASAGLLRLAATDLEVSFSTLVAAEGDLPAGVVSFADLTKRIKTARAETCSIQLERKNGVLVINGGRVEHRIQTMDAKEFPPVPSRSAGTEWRVAGQEFRDALAVALRGVAVESSRYAINGRTASPAASGPDRECHRRTGATHARQRAGPSAPGRFQLHWNLYRDLLSMASVFCYDTGKLGSFGGREGVSRALEPH